MKTTARWIFIICLPVLLLAATICGLANSEWLYRYGSHRYGVQGTLAEAGLPLSDAQLESVYAGLISYYNSTEEYMHITVVSDGRTIDFFSPEEVIHFRDVKGLIRLDYWVGVGALVYFLAYLGVSLFWWRDRSALARGMVGGGVLTIALMVVLAVLNTLVGFDRLFVGFHLLFFTNQYWYTPGLMLLIFPEPFFRFSATLGAGIIAGGAVVMGGVGACYLLRTNGITLR